MGGMFLFTRVLSVQSKMASKQQALCERVVQFYETPKERNPANLPQYRPIDVFFVSLNVLVYKNNWWAKDTKQDLELNPAYERQCHPALLWEYHV